MAGWPELDPALKGMSPDRAGPPPEGGGLFFEGLVNGGWPGLLVPIASVNKVGQVGQINYSSAKVADALKAILADVHPGRPLSAQASALPQATARLRATLGSASVQGPAMHPPSQAMTSRKRAGPLPPA